MALSERERKRKNAAKYIVKTLSHESSVVQRPLSQVDVLNIPNTVEPAIRTWIRKHKGKHEVYGSAAMATQSFIARRPADLDVVVENPRNAASALTRLIRTKKLKTKTVCNKKWNSCVVQIQDRHGNYKDALDIHPIKGHAKKFTLYGESLTPTIKQGISLQRAEEQLLRKANEITKIAKDGMGAAPHRNLKDTQDFVDTAKMLLASMELRSEAKKAKAAKLRGAIRTWESHLKTLKSGKVTKRPPLTKTQKKKYVKRVVEQPQYAVDDWIFENRKRVVRKRKLVKKVKPKNKKRKRETNVLTAIDAEMGRNLRIPKW